MSSHATQHAMYRPPTNGTTSSNGSHNALSKPQSLSSFPSPSRTSSQMSRASRPSKSPYSQPHPESNRSSDHSSNHKSRSSGLSSQPSSIDVAHKYNADAHPRRKLRSQYPRDDPENHVEYILVASFDIDRGPIMEHQYPVAITGDENMLAELMLPDQAHIRNQDWTIFFLHKDTSQDDEDGDAHGSKARRNGKVDGDSEDEDGEDEESSSSHESDTDSEPEGGEGPPLIYVLNLVNTKQDKTAKRGAVVKAMAICTRHPFLHIYKPLLLLALEEYFKSPHPSTLASLYNAVNSMDLSLMPRLTLLERGLLQASDNKDLFVEKFEQMIQMRMAEESGLVQESGTAFTTSPERRPDLTRMGTKAHIEAASTTYAVPRDTHEFETRVMYNGIPIPIKVPVAISPETVGDFSIIKLIQTFSEPHAKSPQPFTPHPHLTTGGPFTHPIIVLVNAMLTQKRVIFLGHNRPSGEVAEAVLAACALASGGILRGFTRHAFPYTDLTKIDDLLKVPGFIAGVTNLIFENHPEWWDVLCDLPSGRITISTRIDPAPVTEGLTYFQQQNPAWANLVNSATSGSGNSDTTGDNVFMQDIMRSISARHGEGVIRAKWREWVTKFCRVAAAFEESVYGASALYIGGDEFNPSNSGVNGHGYVWSDELAKQKELAGSVNRIEGWRNTRSYYSFIQDLAQVYSLRPVKSLDLHYLHDRLRTQKLSPQASRDIYLAIGSAINSYDEICQLLTVTPESHAGLFYIALGLFHQEQDVRLKVVDLLERISVHDAGRHWWNGLSHFQKLAWIRIRREAESGDLKARNEIDLEDDKGQSLTGAILSRR